MGEQHTPPDIPQASKAREYTANTLLALGGLTALSAASIGLFMVIDKPLPKQHVNPQAYVEQMWITGGVVAAGGSLACIGVGLRSPRSAQSLNDQPTITLPDQTIPPHQSLHYDVHNKA